MSSERETRKDERVLHGLAISPGIAIGPAFVTEDSLLDAHLHMLADSRLVRGVERRITADRLNAERAVQAEIGEIGESFAAMGDAYLAGRIEDVRVVGSRLLRNLTKTPYTAFQGLPEGTVILAEELTPADTALLDPRHVAGFATVLGGAESHTAIMARALNLPAVLGIAGLLTGVAPGDTVLIDGGTGVVVVNPAPGTVERYTAQRGVLEREQRRLQRLRRLPAVTRDGVEIMLQANLELPRELDQALTAGAQGLGLVRTEFLYMNREDLPDEDEQYKAYAELVRGMEGRPVTIRTLDIGGDKLAAPLSSVMASEGSNPALGLRAIRLSLKERRLLDAQLAAMLRAATLGPVRILLPMISSVGEIHSVREAMAQVVRRLRRRGVRMPMPLPPLGVMIEIPGAALAADALASAADFFAIGTNDLIQYTLAIDRGDEQVAHLYNPLHPAVLRLIQFAVEAALRARKPVSLCGEMAGDPRFTALLLGLGIRDLSMAPSNVARVKERIRRLDMVSAAHRARAIMDQLDDRRIAALLDDYNALP